MKRATRAWFFDRMDVERDFDPDDHSGRQLVYPSAWYDKMPDASPARAQHDCMLDLHNEVHSLIKGHPRLREYFDTGPVDGSGYRDLYSEHTPAYADGSYATDLVEWSDMLKTILDLVNLDYTLDADSDDEEEQAYFDQAARDELLEPLTKLSSEVASFAEGLKRQDKEKALEKE